jgi:uncharacterized repeat protein (TIGR03803 family)
MNLRISGLRLVITAFAVYCLLGSVQCLAQNASVLTTPPTTLYTFTGGNDGAQPRSFGPALVLGPDRLLYGTAAGGSGGGGVVFKLIPPSKPGGAWTENVIYSFAGGGTGPNSLLFGHDGILYGTTSEGVVFKLIPPSNPDGVWTENVIYRLSDQPSTGLIMDTSGALYGATIGTLSGGGTVFKLTPPSIAGGSWTETVLYTFSGLANGDGSLPYAGPIMDSSGALYGTTGYGGNDSCSGSPGCGTVFKLTPPTTAGGNWTESLLYKFTGGSDGALPSAGLIMDSSGVLYGTTGFGGFLPCYSGRGCGVVFKLTPPLVAGGSWAETVLYSFTDGGGENVSGSDGGQPVAGLIFDSTGALYGTTYNFGPLPGGTGSVFKLTPPTTASGTWTEVILGGFSYTGTLILAGTYPLTGVTMDDMGALYGTTSSGGAFDAGTVYQILTAIFAGTPGTPNCYGQSVAALVHQYGGLAAAAAALGYPSVQALQNAVASYCAS